MMFTIQDAIFSLFITRWGSYIAMGCLPNRFHGIWLLDGLCWYILIMVSWGRCRWAGDISIGCLPNRLHGIRLLGGLCRFPWHFVGWLAETSGTIIELCSIFCVL
ncbi:hypothetical protein AMTRI_Chr08g167210 [Amborella trichopoda]